MDKWDSKELYRKAWAMALKYTIDKFDLPFDFDGEVKTINLTVGQLGVLQDMMEDFVEPEDRDAFYTTIERFQEGYMAGYSECNEEEKIMKETDYINAYRMALAQFNLNQIRNENEMLKTTAGMTAPIPAYRTINTPTYCGEKSIFEPTVESDDGDYKRGFLDGWVKCTDYFIKHELNKEE